MEIRQVRYQAKTVEPEIQGFLDSQLRPDMGYSIWDEYPSVFGEYPGGGSHVAVDKGKVVSHAAFVTREFQYGDLRMRIGLVGSVVTSPEYRGQGMAKRVLTETINELKKRGCAIAVLWTGQPDFYRHLGFFRTGRELDYRFTPDGVPSTDQIAIEYDESRHAHWVWRLYQKHDVRVDRSLEEQKKLCRVPGARLFLTERDGRVLSYIVIHKGADFKNYIHEWGGQPDEVAQNISWVQRNHFRQHNLTLIAPAHYHLREIDHIASAQWYGVLGMMRVLNRPKLIATYLDHVKRVGYEATYFRRDNIIRFPEGVASVVRDEDLLNLVFGEGAFPEYPAIPFFLWGFDSI